MGISFHITSVREGTIFNVMQFLGLEHVTGTLTVRFGRDIPEVTIFFDGGKIATATFGQILGAPVLDVLLCQEFAIKEVSFSPGRLNQDTDKDASVKAFSISEAILNVSKDVDMCQARTLIYGLMPMKDRKGRTAESLLNVLHDFSQWEDELKRAPQAAGDRSAPLKQCVLINRALRKGVLAYQTPLVSLKSLRSLLDIVHPLTDKEATNLRGYMRSLLPHPKATHISIERFYAFATAIESIAQRRSQEVGDKARKAIHEVVDASTKPGEVMRVS